MPNASDHEPSRSSSPSAAGRLSGVVPPPAVRGYVLAAELIARGQLHLARTVVEALDARVSKPGFLALRHMLLKMPPLDQSGIRFMDQPDEDVQIAPRPGARRALFVFCGHAHRVGVPLNLLHRWLAPLGTHVVYLRDFRRMFYLDGIRSVHGTIDGLPAFVERTARQLGASDIAMLGNSGGAYAALKTGLASQASAILGIGGPNTLERIEDDVVKRARLNGFEPAEIVARATPVPSNAMLPPTRLLYADGNEADKWQAERLGFAGNVELQPVVDWSHHAIMGPLAESGALTRHLRWLAGESEQGATDQAGSSTSPERHVPLHSPAGQAALSRAEGHSWTSFETALVGQTARGICGIASALTVMRALDCPPHVPETSNQPALHAFLSRIGADDLLTAALRHGLSLSELDRLLRAAGLETEVVYVADADLEAFRNGARTYLRTGGHVIVNFTRRKLGQVGGGHFSPLSAYDPKSRSFLLVDVATAKSRPLWVRAKALFSAMKPAGSRSDMPSRGFILVSAPTTAPRTVHNSVRGA